MRASTRLGLRFIGLGIALFGAISAQAAVVYSNMYTPLPGNTNSYGYEANGYGEFFDRVSLTSGGMLQSITFTMSDWALYSTYAADPAYTSGGYNQALTVDFYDGATGSILLGTKTITTLVPWRPEATANCTTGSGDALTPKGYGPNCYHGIAFNVTVDFSGMGVILPNDIYFGLALNTQDYGDSPTHVPGPYNSLNVGVGPGATVGSDNPAYAADLAAQIVATAVPEPSTMSLLGISLVGLAAATRRRRPRPA